MYALVALAYLCALVVNAEVLRRMAREDSLIESAGAAFFLIASIGFFALFVRSSRVENLFLGRRTRRNVYLGLLAIGLLVCFGEEISWGQRLFGYSTPSLLTEINVQNETNLHNIRLFQWRNPDGSQKSFAEHLFNMNRLFSIFWLLYFVVLPITAASSDRALRIVKKIGVPIPPGWMGGLFVTSYLSFKVIEILGLGTDRSAALAELKETSYAAVYACIAVFAVIAEFRPSSAVNGPHSKDIEARKPTVSRSPE